MIQVYTGLPGGGKTYKAVADILNMNPKEYFIIHNIDSLVLPPEFVHRHFNDIADDMKTALTREFMSDISDKVRDKYGKNVCIVLDECDEWLDKKDDGIRLWLKNHRHFGQYVLLITQDIGMLHNIYQKLIDTELRAKENSIINMPFLFLYQKRMKGQGCGMKTERKRKEVFLSYKSFEGNKNEKKRPWAMLAFLAVIGLGFYGYLMINPAAATIEKARADRQKEIAQTSKKEKIQDESKSRKETAIQESFFDGVTLKAVFGLEGFERVLLQKGDVQFFAIEKGYRLKNNSVHGVYLRHMRTGDEIWVSFGKREIDLPEQDTGSKKWDGNPPDYRQNPGT